MKIELTKCDVKRIKKVINHRKLNIVGLANKYDAGYLSKNSEREIDMLDELYNKFDEVEK